MCACIFIFRIRRHQYIICIHICVCAYLFLIIWDLRLGLNYIWTSVIKYWKYSHLVGEWPQGVPSTLDVPSESATKGRIEASRPAPALWPVSILYSWYLAINMAYTSSLCIGLLGHCIVSTHLAQRLPYSSDRSSHGRNRPLAVADNFRLQRRGSRPKMNAPPSDVMRFVASRLLSWPCVQSLSALKWWIQLPLFYLRRNTHY